MVNSCRFLGDYEEKCSWHMSVDVLWQDFSLHVPIIERFRVCELI